MPLLVSMFGIFHFLIKLFQRSCEIDFNYMISLVEVADCIFLIFLVTKVMCHSSWPNCKHFPSWMQHTNESNDTPWEWPAWEGKGGGGLFLGALWIIPSAVLQKLLTRLCRMTCMVPVNGSCVTSATITYWMCARTVYSTRSSKRRCCVVRFR